MFILYLLIILTFTYSILLLLDKLNLIKFDNYNLFEKISAVFIFSFLIIVLLFYSLGFLNIEFSQKIFIPMFVISLFIWPLLMYKIIKKIMKYKQNKLKHFDIITIFLGAIIIIYFICFILIALKQKNFFPDEYSVWLLNAKNIFLGKKMNFFSNTGLEVYPNFLPLLYSSYYIFINNVDENMIRVFSTLYAIVGIISMLGICKKQKLDIKLLLALIVIFLTFNSIFKQVVASSYADIPYMVSYGIGIIYLCIWLFDEHSKNNLFLSLINIMSFSFIKTESEYLIIVTLIALILLKLFFTKEKLKWKEIILYSLLILILPLSWRLYCKIANFPPRLVLGGFAINIKYIIPLIQNMLNLIFNDLSWVVPLVIIFYYAFFTRKKKEKNMYLKLVTILYFIIANFGILFISYILLFGAEAITAASFDRYFTRVYLLLIYIILILKKAVIKNERKNFNCNTSL